MGTERIHSVWFLSVDYIYFGFSPDERTEFLVVDLDDLPDLAAFKIALIQQHEVIILVLFFFSLGSV